MSAIKNKIRIHEKNVISFNEVMRMKKIILIAIIFSVLSCKAQTPVLPLNKDFGDINGAYYKDIDNFQDQFAGTWVFSNTSVYLKLILQKKAMFHEIIGVNQYYADYIVGEYQFIENGIEKLNTLSNLVVNHSDIINYGLVGHGQFPKDIFPKCNECALGEKRLEMLVFEPIVKNVSGLVATMIARKFVENGVAKLKIWFVQTHSSNGITKDRQPTEITKHTIPYGEYILIKQ